MANRAELQDQQCTEAKEKFYAALEKKVPRMSMVIGLLISWLQGQMVAVGTADGKGTGREAVRANAEVLLMARSSAGERRESSELLRPTRVRTSRVRLCGSVARRWLSTTSAL